MRGGRNLTEAAAAIEYCPLAFDTPIDLQPLFDNAGARLEVDLGCGGGSFLAALAERNPDANFLGVEQMLGRVRGSCGVIARSGLRNARVIRCEIGLAVRLLPPNSVDLFHLMFPDPWPKRRHHRRRVFSRELLHSLGVALKPEGLLHVATDDAEYFAEMLHIAGGDGAFVATNASIFHDLPRSTFEERFVQAGEQVHRLVLRKVSG